ncbi:MAG: hypothetical protein NTV30_08650 [Chloroflexi bacterium]|nr:hypothetical protein [Chloroflexota bacterium]
MSERRRNEKDEKDEEKRGEKEREKGRDWDEKFRRDWINALVWALVLIWAALIILADTTNYADRFDWWQGWSLFLTGFGAIILLGAFIRLLVPELRRPITGNIILGLILLGIGLGSLVNWGIILPVILIIIAVVILVRGFSGRRRM